MRNLRVLVISVVVGGAGWSVNPVVEAQEPTVQPEIRTIVIPRVSRPPDLKLFFQTNGDGLAPMATETLVARPASTGGAADTGAGASASPYGAVVTEFRQREPGDGTPISAETQAYLSYDSENLYVIFVCRDDPSDIRANIARREDIEADDAVVVYLDTFRDRKRAYLFMVNPRGVQLDGIRTEGQDDDLSFDAVWHAEGQLTDTGYIVRIAIPFRSLRFPRASQQTWGVALGRIIRRNNEESYWPFITEREDGFVPQFAEAQGLSDISPGMNIQVNPYATVARARILDDDAEIPGFRTLNDQRVGMDAKLVLRDAVAVDGTINPDFSQVETDDPQVSVNQRFEVFFPEKRPFFLENAGYFQTPVNLFFSRRIQDPGAGLDRKSVV